MVLGVDSASNRNEYQEYFLGGKDGRCVGLTTLTPLCADCLLTLLNAELNPIRHLLALVGAHHFVHVSKLRVNLGVSTSWNHQGLSRDYFS